MKNLKTILTVTACACALSLSGTAAISIGTSYVGDVGNANDSTGFGGVSYGYHIGTYEVTNNQYVSFLNATASTDTHGLYNSSMNSSSDGGIQRSSTSGSFTYSVKSGMGEKAVNFVSFWDAARFTNWLTSGNTEEGVYNLDGVTAPVNNTITRDATAWNAGGVAIASENEWYKAAYYQPAGAGGDADSYWLYPTASNSIMPADANYNDSVGTLTDVGTYSDYASYYGTFDQGGNVWEWNDELVVSFTRGLRGGSFDLDFDVDDLKSSTRASIGPTDEGDYIGFRVSSLGPIPEPSTCVLGCLALTIAIVRRRGRGTL